MGNWPLHISNSSWPCFPLHLLQGWTSRWVAWQSPPSHLGSVPEYWQARAGTSSSMLHRCCKAYAKLQVVQVIAHSYFLQWSCMHGMHLCLSGSPSSGPDSLPAWRDWHFITPVSVTKSPSFSNTTPSLSCCLQYQFYPIMILIHLKQESQASPGTEGVQKGDGSVSFMWPVLYSSVPRDLGASSCSPKRSGLGKRKPCLSQRCIDSTSLLDSLLLGLP